MVTLTEEATKKVTELLAQETEDMALRVAVRPGGCSGFSYEMYFDTDKAEDDVEKLFDEVRVAIIENPDKKSFFSLKDRVKMVGGDLLKYSSKCVIELIKYSDCNGLVLRRHRSLEEGLEVKFKIKEKGLEKID